MDQAILVGLITPGSTPNQTKEYLDELAFLAKTAGVSPKIRFTQKLPKPDNKTFLGKGKIEEIRKYVSDYQINLIIFDDDGGKSNIFSDEATIYSETDLIDLRKNVIIVTQANDTLFADQLFYDQEKEWLFTNQPIIFKSKDQVINANAYSSDSKIEKGGLSEVTGIVFLDEN